MTYMYGIAITYGVVSMLLLIVFAYINLTWYKNKKSLISILNYLIIQNLIVDKWFIFASIK